MENLRTTRAPFDAAQRAQLSSSSLPQVFDAENIPYEGVVLEEGSSSNPAAGLPDSEHWQQEASRESDEHESDSADEQSIQASEMTPSSGHSLGQDANEASTRPNKSEPSPLIFPSIQNSRSARKASAKAMVKDMKPSIDHRVESIPISKEKEAILTCTRPTYLPPKSRKEEKKHLKEFERLMFGSLEAEKKSQKRRSKAMVQKAKHLTNSADTWTNQILPHFASAVKDPRTKQLWWNGLPNRVRGEVWYTCVGNTLSVTAETFKLATEKSLQTEKILKTRQEDEDDPDQLLTLESYELLDKSVAQTFIELRIFQKGGPLHESLVQVLKAYLYYRQDVMVSYVEGVNSIAGLLLMYLSPLQTFVTLVNVLNRSLPLALYTRDEPVLNRFVAVFITKLSERLPLLHRHLHSDLGIAPLSYLEPMLLSLLSKQAPPDVSSRIFDIYAFEGDAFLIRAVIAVFVSLEHALYGRTEDVMSVLSGEDKEHTWEKNLKEDEFIQRCKYAF
ncbi:Putative uncharacterized protein [Taphrina deformans PYCC 5710]|uniref:Rab-GAP TBC domain-containing protein n=1 Tax=Taphrina deformans (strain PYCC 5710 / ATCC 11124 / CBS 356.35 / IMI 108563 / JCM 9778 / NBRC 8474) TaxID=1097556 RepID=R4X9D1_TAPDE|nr:Putative uncharacterized protein [Taphrina deformans PYCC 5710]|eukprot:CCG80814.1 Putative uncharacterized protein [Taphrina deformans PYCC 5710]